MKLLLDENLSPRQAAILKGLGYDALSVNEAGLGGEPDDRIRAYAIEGDRILVTLDSDFANILKFPPAGTPGVIRLKVRPLTETEIQERILKTLQRLKNTPLSGCLAVSDGDVIRVRR